MKKLWLVAMLVVAMEIMAGIVAHAGIEEDIAGFSVQCVGGDVVGAALAAEGVTTNGLATNRDWRAWFDLQQQIPRWYLLAKEYGDAIRTAVKGKNTLAQYRLIPVMESGTYTLYILQLDTLISEALFKQGQLTATINHNLTAQLPIKRTITQLRDQVLKDVVLPAARGGLRRDGQTFVGAAGKQALEDRIVPIIDAMNAPLLTGFEEALAAEGVEQVPLNRDLLKAVVEAVSAKCMRDGLTVTSDITILRLGLGAEKFASWQSVYNDGGEFTFPW